MYIYTTAIQSFIPTHRASSSPHLAKSQSGGGYWGSGGGWGFGKWQNQSFHTKARILLGGLPLSTTTPFIEDILSRELRITTNTLFGFRYFFLRSYTSFGTHLWDGWGRLLGGGNSRVIFFFRYNLCNSTGTDEAACIDRPYIWGYRAVVKNLGGWTNTIIM
jgi:hypothetical protein